MRPRRFILPQAGTGEQCSPLQEFSPVWARNIPARRTVLSPTACGRSPLAEGAKRGRCPAWSCLPLLKTRSVGAHSICARGSLSYRKRARADMESAPTFLWRAEAPPQRAAPRAELSPFVESEIRRGAFYMRPRKFALPQAGTGGYGIRPYVFEAAKSPRRGRRPAWSFLPLLEA